MMKARVIGSLNMALNWAESQVLEVEEGCVLGRLFNKADFSCCDTKFDVSM